MGRRNWNFRRHREQVVLTARADLRISHAASAVKAETSASRKRGPRRARTPLASRALAAITARLAGDNPRAVGCL